MSALRKPTVFDSRKYPGESIHLNIPINRLERLRFQWLERDFKSQGISMPLAWIRENREGRGPLKNARSW